MDGGYTKVDWESWSGCECSCGQADCTHIIPIETTIQNIMGFYILFYILDKQLTNEDLQVESKKWIKLAEETVRNQKIEEYKKGKNITKIVTVYCECE